ncbi:ATP-binding cassette sub-family A member 6 [Tenrec ecaudatus]|uniref:ATP-binding cassette sub-family A member 6 n=1 Tax=Tenrec ecaudatus TaxID=94439 RepID=UPI003F5A86C8
MHKKKKSVYQQTQALLYKNFLKQWRMKRLSLLEWGLPVLLGLYMGLLSYFRINDYIPGIPPQELGRVDTFNRSYVEVVYTPVSNRTQQIMDKVASAPFLKGRRVVGARDETALDKLILDNTPHSMAVIFNDAFSYKLKHFQGYGIPYIKEEHLSAHCWMGYNEFWCTQMVYWMNGFVTLQTAINAAIIEITTNHSVMDQLMSVTGINMKVLPFISKTLFQNETFMLYCLTYFSPFIYFASLNVTKERKRLKDLMKTMGLRDSAFWLSWALTYAGFIFIISMLITIVITSTKTIVMTGFMVIFTLFFLFGLSLITLVFLMSVLLKKSSLTSLAVFVLTLFWGCVGFTVLHKQIPSSLVWILSIFSPFAFTSGMAQIIHVDYYLYDGLFSDSSGDSSVVIGPFSMLVFDCLLYLVLALYWDRVLPYGNERRYSLLFFLNSSNCVQQQRIDRAIERAIDPEHSPDDCFEPVAPEFHGKEAIRIRNIRKEYKRKSGNVEALKGLFFDIYEGQITAILGHSGSGKSTLLHILNGLSVPTEGSVTVYNRNLADLQDLEEVQNITGVCPQFNVQIDMLTVKENLRLFAKIKGIQPQEVEPEVQRILLELDMQNLQDSIAQNLSEGQKRKLTFGIAILGDPKILLLDEPTAGLDPFSRHQVWNYLKERKSDHVILLSTSFTDEADILADRKMIMSNGRLMCAGSSLFLKRQWGLGYDLSLHRNEMCDPEEITSFLKHHIPEANLKTQSQDKLVYTLPAERMSAFADLFGGLDKCCGQGIRSYDISTSTLSEVLMKLEGKSTVRQDFFQSKAIRDPGSHQEVDPACSAPPEMQNLTQSGMALWRLQVCAIARLQFLKLKHGKRTLLTLLVMLGIAMLPFTVDNLLIAILNKNGHLEFKPELYFLSPGQISKEPLTSLLIINNTGSNIEDFIHSLKRQNILLEVDDFKNKNGTQDLSYNGVIIVSGNRKDYRFSVVCNIKRLHCYPVLMNIVSNGLLGMFNHAESIRIERDSLEWISLWIGLPESLVFIFLVACSVAPYIAMNSVSDHKTRAHSQLWTSGLYPSAYWCGQALVDVTLYLLILIAMFLFYKITLVNPIYLTNLIVFALVLTTIGYAASLVFLTYVISFIFHKRRKTNIIVSFCFFMSIFLTTIIFNWFGIMIFFIPMILVPPTTLNGFILFIEEQHYMHIRTMDDTDFDFSAADFLVCSIPYFQVIIFLFVLRWLELKCGKKIMQKDPVFRISPQSIAAQPKPEEPAEEDEDVVAERRRAATALTTSNIEEKPVIIASCLHKEYAGTKKCCFSKKKKKIAARNISFCVKEGEILGLLGPNGAGKSSCARMITGITKPTSGKIELKGSSPVGDHRGESLVRFLGYCPQENPLWPNLTIREHLEVYTAVKGLKGGDASAAITRILDAFQLKKMLDVPVEKLTAGTSRMLSLALSILGNSPVLLLDEPSTNLDPTMQQQMWQMIQAAVKNSRKGALLITHYLAEAEALCDRVAIMVSGRLRCIGPIEHLRSKFGKDYVLEIKMKEPSQVTLVHMEILKLFPQAARQERSLSFLAYKLPVADVQPLSQAFHRLEAVKRKFNLEGYNLSQSTLEQVFLELSKEQELEDADAEVGTSMRWKLLSPSEDL